jgi:energy-coupling factor transporter ATP-binding protein EcfA2
VPIIGDVSRLDVGPSAEFPLRSCVELQKFALTSFEEILSEAERPIDWVWKGCASKSNVVMLCGPPGGGKTTLLFLILAALASRSSVSLLGRNMTPMPAGQVIVLIEGEQGQASTCRKLLASCFVQGIPSETALVDADTGVTRIVILARKSVLVGDDRWKEIVRMIGAGVVGHVAIDTLARCAPGDSNDEKEQTRVFEQICGAIESGPIDRRPTVWILSHSNKKEPTYTVNDVSGSAARAGQADSVALVYPNMVEGQLHSVTLYWPKVRDADEPLEAVTYTMRGKEFAIVEKPMRSKGGTANGTAELRARLLEYVEAHPGLYANAIASPKSEGGVGANKSSIIALLPSMAAEGLLRNDAGMFYTTHADIDFP